jgi:hypothetical protein
MDLNAKLVTEYIISGKATGPDGYVCEFAADDSFKSWFAIVRWNWHYKHWAALRGNVRSLFVNVIWRKMWRR